MDIEKLCKDDFIDITRGEPRVRFTYSGLVSLNRSAIKHLLLANKDGYHRLTVCRDPLHKSEFFVLRDDVDGWELRKASNGSAVFNSVGLARLVIDTTWEKCVAHAVDAVKPSSWVFRIARRPVDDDKNKNVFALIRKKE